MTPTVRLPGPAPVAGRRPAATGRWGARLSLVVPLPVADPVERVTAPTRPVYAGGMIAGFLPAACAAALPRRRSAGT
ncbi:hypothetical protein [Streptomyces sp. NPDC096068]|uniref:hypothetical protein n=1 Tax=Streptomyces sp. NPDC096068 TaxID=3155424 RepID=UPI003333179B